MATKAPTLYLIDGHAQMYRSYHVHMRENRRATDGTPTGALFGFYNSLKTVRSRFKPDYLGCVFDPEGGTFREKEFAGYKAQRAPMPDDLRKQIPYVLELCRCSGIPATQLEGFEADDVLGALAHQATSHGIKTIIVTGDKDLLQLVSKDIEVYDPFKDIQYTPEKVLEVKGMKPEQIVDWLGLMGDAADNIPGVTSVGEQTAIKLLEEHGSMEKILTHYQEKYKDRAAEITAFIEDKKAGKTVKPPKGLKVLDCYLFTEHEAARASRHLATLQTDLPVKFDLDEFRLKDPNRELLGPLFAKLDFRQFLREIGGVAAASAAPAATGAQGTFFDLGEASKSGKVEKAADIRPMLTASEQKTSEDIASREYHIVDTAEKLTDFSKQLAKQKRFAFDTETTYHRPLDPQTKLVGMSFSWKEKEAWYLPVRGPEGSQLLDEKAALDIVKKPLENSKVGKIGQNCKFDIQVMSSVGIEVRGIEMDTMIAGWLVDPGAMRHDLDALCYTYLSLRKTATESLIGKNKAPSMDFVPVKAVANYACEDADMTLRLSNVLVEKIEAAHLTKLQEELELPFINVLIAMEKAGVYVDAEMLKEMSVTLGEQIKTQEEEIYKAAGETFNIGSPKQLGVILFEKLGLENQGMTATGQYKTGEPELQIIASSHPLPRMILDYRQFTKLKNTYVDMLPTMAGPDGRIHASFSQIGSETGRLASHDPNLQNIPVRTELGRSIRAAFKPKAPPGVKAKFKILAADYSQIELRILAHYSLDPVLKEGFARGVDVHTAVAARIFGVKEEAVNRDQRARAKTVNFGVLYGQTAYGLSQTLSIPKKEASVIIDRFFEGHPKVRTCLDEIIAEADEKGYVSTILGRRRFVPQLKEKATRKLGERIAVNTVFQGSAADLIKKAMLEIQDALNKDSDLQTRMILQIHDELLFECPEKSVPALTKLVKGKMEGALKLKVPLVVETGVGDDWLSAKE